MTINVQARTEASVLIYAFIGPRNHHFDSLCASFPTIFPCRVKSPEPYSSPHLNSTSSFFPIRQLLLRTHGTSTHGLNLHHAFPAFTPQLPLRSSDKPRRGPTLRVDRPIFGVVEIRRLDPTSTKQPRDIDEAVQDGICEKTSDETV